MSKSKILVTGAAGFIGYHLCKALCLTGYSVVGIDNLNDYYDINLKKDRLKLLKQFKNFQFIKLNLEDRANLEKLFEVSKVEYVFNLAAQAGVRYSLKNPSSYISSNLVGFGNILETCRRYEIKHLLYASSSSVYGGNTEIPFSVNHNVDHPISLYAASKKSNELMAHAYSHLYDLPTTGLRFFTVYGPYGRPDMALFLFTKAIIEGTPINIFNRGRMKRDFTYIDDVVEAMIKLISLAPKKAIKTNEIDITPNNSWAPYKVYNIGNNEPIELMFFIETIEAALNKKAQKKFMGMQPGDMMETYADVDQLVKDIGYKPSTNIETGVKRFVDWYTTYYKSNCINS